MLSIKPGHFHVTNHQVIRLAISLLQRLATIELHIYLKALILQNIGDEPRHGGLVFHHQNTIRVLAQETGWPRSWACGISGPGSGSHPCSVGVRQVGGFGYAAGRAQGNRKYCSTVWRTRDVYVSSMLPHDAQH